MLVSWLYVCRMFLFGIASIFNLHFFCFDMVVANLALFLCITMSSENEFAIFICI